ncbi:hypothetical protein OESDEN_19350, partial [Oesophagostomum dentatum]
LESYVRANGLTLEKVLLHEAVENKGGELVVTYAMFGVNCKQITEALREMRIDGVLDVKCNIVS